MPELNLPVVDLKLREEDGMLKVFDPLRGRYVALTPEEYVRQHFAAWLCSEFHCPPSLTSNEIGIEVNGTRRRCDTVVFDRKGAPLIIVEYKQPNVVITQTVFDQIARYNMALHARYLIVSNGLTHYCCKMDYAAHTYHFIPRIPDFNEITNPFSEN